MGSASQRVLIKRFAEVTGYSENAVRHKIKGGVWIEGRIWRKGPDGRIFVHLGEFERWVKSDAPRQSLLIPVGSGRCRVERDDGAHALKDRIIPPPPDCVGRQCAPVPRERFSLC